MEIVQSLYQYQQFISNACAIPDDENDQVYITGGSAQEIVRFPTYLSLETVSGLS